MLGPGWALMLVAYLVGHILSPANFDMVGHFLPAMVPDVVGHCLSPPRDVHEKVGKFMEIEIRDNLVT